MQKLIILMFFAMSAAGSGCGPSHKISQAPSAPTTPNKDTVAVSQPVTNADEGLLANLLRQYPAYFDSILQQKDELKVQIIYTQIDRDEHNEPHFTNHEFNVNKSKYFYPASTVKMPAALLALQKLKDLKINGLSKTTTMVTEAGYGRQTPVYNDPFTKDGKPSIAQYIKRIFLVSENDAFNRLYEFLGQDYLNTELRRKGYKEAEVIHRLDIALSEDENRHTNPIIFIDPSGRKIYDQPMQFNEKSYLRRHDFLGNGYYVGNELKTEAMDFSKKNRVSLESLHEILKSIMFPHSVSARQRFDIDEEDYKFVWQYMSQLPGETTYPPYDTATYYDTYSKFLLFGSDRNAKIPPGIRIFNKIGDAYGFLIDAAYIVDFENKVEFMLCATIYCNRDNLLNDDLYDYDSVGFPFMKHLGEVVYEYEKKREKKYQPDLSGFKLKYDK